MPSIQIVAFYEFWHEYEFIFLLFISFSWLIVFFGISAWLAPEQELMCRVSKMQYFIYLQIDKPILLFLISIFSFFFHISALIAPVDVLMCRIRACLTWSKKKRFINISMYFFLRNLFLIYYYFGRWTSLFAASLRVTNNARRIYFRMWRFIHYLFSYLSVFFFLVSSFIFCFFNFSIISASGPGYVPHSRE